MNYTELVEKLVKKSITLGADASEVFLESNRNLSVNVLKSEIETIEEANSKGIGFRVFVDGRMGFSHCNDFSDRSLEDTITKAINFAKLSSPDDNNVLTDGKGITIAGRAFDILNSIDMMGNDLDLNRTFSAPTFRVREMQIGGK